MEELIASDPDERATRNMQQSRSFARRAQEKLPELLKFAALAVIIPVLIVSVLGEVLEFARTLNDSKTAANKDFISYWAAARLLADHRNPYDPPRVQAIERSVGYLPHRGITMRNPPVALALVLPLALMPVKWAAFVWSLLIVACAAVTVHLIWVIHHRPSNKIHLLGFLFPATLSCFAAGQTSVFALTGLALFFRFQRTRPFLAGMCIAACLIKPHLFIPFGVVLLLWAVVNKAWPLALGACTAVAVTLAIVMPFDGALWPEYFALLRGPGISQEFIPVVGSLIRLLIAPNKMWVQFVPAPLGVVWAIFFYRRHRKHWDWRSHGSLVLLISLLVAPYAWFFDEIVVLPAVLHALYASKNQQRAVIGFGMISSLAMVETLAGAPLYSGYYMWTTPAWLAWFIIETRQHVFEKTAGKTLLAGPPLPIK